MVSLDAYELVEFILNTSKGGHNLIIIFGVLIIQGCRSRNASVSTKAVAHREGVRTRRGLRGGSVGIVAPLL